MDVWVPRSELDRSPEHRDDESWVAAQWSRRDARVLSVDASARVSVSGDGTVLRASVARGTYDPQRHFLVGLAGVVPWFAGEAADGGPMASLREVGAVLSATEADVATTALALVTWHRDAPYCARCGTLTDVRSGGQQRWCHRCEQPLFPRTDPAVIVAVVSADDRLLLAHQTVWNTTTMSLLAGFVEAGESLEHAVHREIAEEVGISLTTVRYVGSQPWPFPRSLMLGFAATADDSPIRVDGQEIDHARYFTRAELAAAISQGEVTLPGPASLAHRMIAAWREGHRE